MPAISYHPLDEIYANELLAIWADKDVIQYTNIAEPCSLETIKEKIQIFKPFDVFVVLKDNKVIGVVGCPYIEKEAAQYGLFYQFRKSVWGQGYATMAVKWLLDFMNKKYKNITLFADVITENKASEKILTRFGFVCQSETTSKHKGNNVIIRNYILKKD